MAMPLRSASDGTSRCPVRAQEPWRQRVEHSRRLLLAAQGANGWWRDAKHGGDPPHPLRGHHFDRRGAHFCCSTALDQGEGAEVVVPPGYQAKDGRPAHLDKLLRSYCLCAKPHPELPSFHTSVVAPPRLGLHALHGYGNALFPNGASTFQLLFGRRPVTKCSLPLTPEGTVSNEEGRVAPLQFREGLGHRAQR